MRNSTGTGNDRLVIQPSWWGKWWLPVSKVLAVIGGFALFLGGILLASRQAQDSLAEDDRYSISFSEIECNAPAGGDRLTFLMEVWYLAESPPRINLLDRNLHETLDAALRKHPRVEQLESLMVTPDKRLRLEIRFRPS